MPLIPCWLIELQSSIEQFLFKFYGAAAPDFNSLIPTPSVPLLISSEPVELFCRARNNSSTNSLCFIKQKQETVEVFLQFFIYKYAQLRPACAERIFTAIKATAQHLITIKHGDQHSSPNRNPKHNQIETKIHYSFRHVDVLTRIAKIHVVTLYTVYEQMHLSYI